MIDSSAPNQPAQNYEIVNPTLETQVANLLPSVAGYGGNLRATNTIVPVIDLTAAAEGSTVPESFQQAIAFGSQTVVSQVGAGTTVIANSPGFWRLVATSNVDTANTNHTVKLQLTDGVSTKTVWEMGNLPSVSTGTSMSVNIDQIYFLASGESLQVVCSHNNYTALTGSVRQVGTSAGVLVTPSGF